MSGHEPIEAGCPECERLREEIADYMGYRTDNIAGKLWAAERLFQNFEAQLDDILGEFDSLSHDYYDQSLEIHDAHRDLRLGEYAQRLIRDAGFSIVYVNHGDKGDNYRQETHYTLTGDLPVRGWRRRYVSDPSGPGNRVILGDPDPGYFEISYWPEGWDNPRMLAELDAGYFRIVPDPLDTSETKYKEARP